MTDSTQKPEGLVIRTATREDIGLIFTLIKELAEYERMREEVVATEALLEEWMFDKEKAEAFIAEWNGETAGFALFCYNFSTFVGRAGIYLEDLFVRPQYRHKGIGKVLLSKVARAAVDRGCGRMEWQCLDWNKPSIHFYKSLGARAMEDWTTYRFAGKTLQDVANMSDQAE